MSGIPIHQGETPIAPPQAPAIGQPSLVALSMTSFLSMTLPERGFLLSPILPSQGIAIMYAPRGIGKTFVPLRPASVGAGNQPGGIRGVGEARRESEPAHAGGA